MLLFWMSSQQIILSRMAPVTHWLDKKPSWHWKYLQTLSFYAIFTNLFQLNKYELSKIWEHTFPVSFTTDNCIIIHRNPDKEIEYILGKLIFTWELRHKVSAPFDLPMNTYFPSDKASTVSPSRTSTYSSVQSTPFPYRSKSSEVRVIF